MSESPLVGRTPEVLTAWLRKILAHTLADTLKHYRRARRDVDLERSLEADLDRSSSGLAAFLGGGYCGGQTMQHIADQLGKTVPAVASLLRRGLAALRERLHAGD